MSSTTSWYPLVRFPRGSASAPVMAAILLVGGVAACTETGPDGASEEDRTAIEIVLADYLPKLGNAYFTGDFDALASGAVPKEIATVRKRVHDLEMERSRTLRPMLKSFEIERIDVWRYSNAAVTTIEVWDIDSLASGTERLLSSGTDRYRVRYQFKRRDEGWMVIDRRIEHQFES
ncbi:MAG: hypothetical protein F4Z19_02050 [Holophagales bacterium]|nr:hypothetical protein [Holophagales bacterium]MYJ27008.1 hypothetical protein [Holophagales bacterium]